MSFTFNDLVAPNDFPAFLQKQAQEGVNLIYSDSAWFEAVKAVAPKYLKTWFVMPELAEDDLKNWQISITREKVLKAISIKGK